MTKVSTIIFMVLWTLALPIAILAVGFAGNKLWLPSAVYEDIVHSRWEAIIVRLGLALYVLAPIWVLRSYRKNRT